MKNVIFGVEFELRSPIAIRLQKNAYRVLMKVDGVERVEHFGMMTEFQAIRKMVSLGRSLLSWHDLDMTSTLERLNELNEWEFVDDGYVVPSYKVVFVTNRQIVGK
ncbi:MAG: hypothetical protein H6R19_2476 [Proteobacteria bacterium]|nr:hypothetical protein [Pseudomonadota bacterium]